MRVLEAIEKLPPTTRPEAVPPPSSMTGVMPGPRDTPHPDDMDPESAGDDGGTANAPLGSTRSSRRQP